jgi:DNA-binding transcriptional LysR family regulator
MEFRQLRSLVTLADLGSIAAAAQRLHLSPPAIHKQLRGLEAELGIPLYEKAGRTLRLTKACEMLLLRARELLSQHDLTVSAVEEWKGLKRGVVRIGAGPTISSYLLPGLLRRFRRAHPNVELYVETGNTQTLIQSLASGSLDLGLLVASESQEEPYLSVEVVWEVEFVLVSNLREPPRRCALADLRRFPFILYKKGSRIENLIELYFAETGFQPSVIMTFDTAEAIKAMIRTGLGISMLPMWIVDAELRRGTLSIIHQRERPLLSRVELVSRKASQQPQAVRAFIGLAQDFRFRTPRLIYR